VVPFVAVEDRDYETIRRTLHRADNLYAGEVAGLFGVDNFADVEE
jgi:hypothetical protein